MGQVRWASWSVAVVAVLALGGVSVKADVTSDRAAAILIWPNIEVETYNYNDTVETHIAEAGLDDHEGHDHGDAGEEEYGVKAPAYKWDIEHLDSEIKNSKGGTQYMINLQSLVPGEEIEELENLAQSDYSELDTIEGVSPDTIARMKETLSEALNTLQG